MQKTDEVTLIPMLLITFVMLFCGCVQKVQRYGSVIGIPKEGIAEYRRLHANTWPSVLRMINKCNIRNYSIYLGEVEPDKYYLFSYFEYIGSDFDADKVGMAKDKTTQNWWKHTDPLQKPLPTRKQGEWWAGWEEVFHFEGPQVRNKKPQRFGSVIGLKNDRKSIIAYSQLHAAVWPGVLAAIERANIRKYSIYMGQIEPDKYYLFSYFEYYGDNFEVDMDKIAQDEITRVWWSYTDPLQNRLPGTQDGQQWKSMEEVFHTD